VSTRPDEAAHRLTIPPDLPPGRLVALPDRGETFVRDSGGTGPPLLLLHGWMFAADLNWYPSYRALVDAGYRVLALDHRGHGRGLRTPDAFRLADCADDAAALLRALDCGPVLSAGYSMGGPIAALLARRHPELIRGTVYCATACHWSEPRLRVFWQGMGALRLVLGPFPLETWRRLLRRWGSSDTPLTTWMASELSRGSARDLAEAGRELGRFDSRAWVGALDSPAAVVLTTRDRSVPPRKQRELAGLLGAPLFEVPADHFAVTQATEAFNHALLAALSAVAQRSAKPQSVAAVAG